MVNNFTNINKTNNHSISEHKKTTIYDLVLAIDPDIVLSMFMLSFNFVCGSGYREVYIDHFTAVLLFEIQLSKGGWNPIKRFNLATSLCLSQAKTKSYIVVF
jgi:hypothetical protein